MEQLLAYPLFVPGASRLAIGNETDMLHPSNVEYLLELLATFEGAGLNNTIALITKAPLTYQVMDVIRRIRKLHIVFCLSYSGLGPRFEPNFTDQGLKTNFDVVGESGFPIVHFWRPLLPENTTRQAIETMLRFVSEKADATVFVGLKLHPELTNIISRNGVVAVPASRQHETGELLELETIELIYFLAKQICPGYPLYRHTSCALAKIAACRNHTGTVYRSDICPKSQCPVGQRRICEAARLIPSVDEITAILHRIGRPIRYSRTDVCVSISDTLSQEEYCFVVQHLSCPVKVAHIDMQNLYYGSILEGSGTARTTSGGISLEQYSEKAQ